MRASSHERHEPRPGRRGVTVVYLLVSWVAIVAFAALAVDFGRVQRDGEQL